MFCLPSPAQCPPGRKRRLMKTISTEWKQNCSMIPLIEFWPTHILVSFTLSFRGIFQFPPMPWCPLAASLPGVEFKEDPLTHCTGSCGPFTGANQMHWWISEWPTYYHAGWAQCRKVSPPTVFLAIHSLGLKILQHLQELLINSFSFWKSNAINEQEWDNSRALSKVALSQADNMDGMFLNS